MRLKTNLVVGLVFVGLLGYVYFYEIKGREEQREAAEKSSQLLDFSDSDAEKLVIDRGDTLIVLENHDGDWVLQEPVQDAADQGAVERYLRHLNESKRERVIGDSATVAGDSGLADRYQLQPPRLKVLLETEGGVLDTLFFGADSPTERFVYVQQSGDNPEIFTVRAWIYDNLNKGVFDLRDRRVLNFHENEVREIRLGYVGSQIVLQRADEDTWEMQIPVEAPADEAEVDKLLKSLSGAQIEEFADEKPDEQVLSERGLTSAMLEISLLVGEDRAEKRLHIGAQEGGRYYVRDPSRVATFLVDSTLVQALQKRKFDLRDKEPIKFDKDAVSRIELHGSEQKIVAEKDTSGTWAIVEPEAREAKSWKLISLLGDLEGVEVKEFVGDGVEDLAPFGLEEPQLRIILRAQGEEPLEVRLGGEKGNRIHLVRIGVPSVYLVEGKTLGKLDQNLDDLSRLPKNAD
jgi:hypothetical protein